MKHNKQNVYRSQYLDIVKGIAILAMVLGHSIQYGGGELFYHSRIFFENYTFRFIYGFHMPLLMFVSGYLFSFTYLKYKKKEIIKKKTRSLLIPIFINGVLFAFLFDSFTDFSTLKGTYMSLRHAVYHITDKFWFLWAVLYSVFFLMSIKLVSKNNKITEYLLCFLLCICMYLIPDTLIDNFALYKYMTPFFILGFYSNSERFKNIIQKYDKLWIKVLLLALYSISIVFFHTRQFVYNSGSYIFSTPYSCNNILIFIQRNITSFIGVITILSIVSSSLRHISRTTKNILAYVGKNSLGVYIYSTFMFEFLKFHLYSEYNILYIFLTFITFSTLSLFLTFIIQRNRISNLLFLGGR